jgi:hypothetical protein
MADVDKNETTLCRTAVEFAKRTSLPAGIDTAVDRIIKAITTTIVIPASQVL